MEVVQQSTYNICKEEMKQLKTNIIFNIKNATKYFDRLVAESATKHDKKHLLQGIEFKIDSMNVTWGLSLLRQLLC